jgi:hypothetical protein
MSRTPEEIGEMLQQGRITREEAVEMMDRRAQEQAFATMHRQMQGASGADGAASEPQRMSRELILTTLGVAAAVLGLVALIVYLASCL